MVNYWELFIQITSEYTGVSPALITPYTKIKDLDLDSMDALNIMLEYEEKLEINTDPDADHEWAGGTVSDLCMFLNSHGAKIVIPQVT